jgi:transposase
VLPPDAVVTVGVEAAGHYHRPLLEPSAWPVGWQIVELNPAHVTEQRRVQGRRRVKTDAIDLEAITELLLTGAGTPITTRTAVLAELTGWSAHRARRVATRTATKNQLLGQLDRSFPGLTLALPDVLGTKVGRLVATEFADPARLVALGVARFVRLAATRELIVRRRLAERIVAAAQDALPTTDGVVTRRVLAADLALLADLDAQITAAEAELARLLPASPFQPLTSVPGWGIVRAANYGAALGDPGRWPSPRQVYRAAGLSPMQYESAGTRRDRGDQPGGQRRAAAGVDRSGCGAVALRSTREGPRRRTESSRQTRWSHRLCTGPPRQPHRVRPGPRPGQLRPDPVGGAGRLTALHNHDRGCEAG